MAEVLTFPFQSLHIESILLTTGRLLVGDKICSAQYRNLDAFKRGWYAIGPGVLEIESRHAGKDVDVDGCPRIAVSRQCMCARDEKTHVVMHQRGEQVVVVLIEHE